MAYRWKAQSGMTEYDFASAAIATYEASRNTDPGIANVASGTSYKIYNEDLTGTMGSVPSITLGPDAYASTITASGATFTLTKVPTGTNTVKIGYRPLAFRNTDALTLSSTISSPVVGSTVSITGLTEGATYQIVPLGYDSSSYISQPGGVFNIVPSNGYEHARDIAENVKTILSDNMPEELLTIGTREGLTLETVKQFISTVAGVDINYPLVAVIPMESSCEKIGNRKIWVYRLRVEIILMDRGGDARNLEKNIEYYIEAAENVIDQNDTAGATVWEIEVTDKQYPDVTSDYFGHIMQSGILMFTAEQTN